MRTKIITLLLSVTFSAIGLSSASPADALLPDESDALLPDESDALLPDESDALLPNVAIGLSSPLVFEIFRMNAPPDLFRLGLANKKMREIVFDQFNNESYRRSFPSYLWSCKYVGSQYIPVRISNALNSYEKLNYERMYRDLKGLSFGKNKLTNILLQSAIWNLIAAQVWDQVWDQVWAQVWTQVGAQVWAQVRAQVGTQVRAQVRDQVGAQVRDQVGAQV